MSIPTDEIKEFMGGHGGGGHGGGRWHGGGGHGGGGHWGGGGHGGGRWHGGGGGHGGGRWGRGWGNNYYGDWGNYGGTYYPWYAYDSYYPYGLYSYSYPVVSQIPQQNIVTQNLGTCECKTDPTDSSRIEISNQCTNMSVPICVSKNSCQCQTLQ